MDLEQKAIEILKTFETNDAYVISDSGGKDSSVLRHIALISNVKHKVVHNLTTVDAPETVYYVRRIKKEYDKMGIEYEIIKPYLSMWQLIVKHKTPPTRLIRYCCEELKEYYGKGKKIVTGVRKYESRNRRNNQGIITFPKPNKALRNEVDNENFYLTNRGGVILHNIDNHESRRVVENCYRTSKTLINPLLEWDDEFLWWYIRKKEISLNPLYQEGFFRVGCVGCPMGGKNRWKEFARYPTYKQAYLRAFDTMLKAREAKGLENKAGWKDADSVFRWWMEDKNMDGQLSFIDNENELMW